MANGIMMQRVKERRVVVEDFAVSSFDELASKLVGCKCFFIVKTDRLNYTDDNDLMYLAYCDGQTYSSRVDVTSGSISSGFSYNITEVEENDFKFDPKTGILTSNVGWQGLHSSYKLIAFF